MKIQSKSGNMELPIIYYGDTIFPKNVIQKVEKHILFTENIKNIVIEYIHKFDNIKLIRSLCEYYGINENKDIQDDTIYLLMYLLGNKDFVGNMGFADKYGTQKVEVDVAIDDLIKVLEAVIQGTITYEYEEGKPFSTLLNHNEYLEKVFALFRIGLRRCILNKEYVRIGSKYMFSYNSIFGMIISCLKCEFSQEDIDIAVQKRNGVYTHNGYDFIKVSGYEYAPNCLNALFVRHGSNLYKIELVPSSFLINESRSTSLFPEIRKSELD